jgi:hypothetical protein
MGKGASVYKIWFETPVGIGLCGKTHASWKLILQWLLQNSQYTVRLMNRVSVLPGNAEAKSHGYDSLELYHHSVSQDLNCRANRRKPMAATMNTAAGTEDRMHCCLSESKGCIIYLCPQLMMMLICTQILFSVHMHLDDIHKININWSSNVTWTATAQQSTHGLKFGYL